MYRAKTGEAVDARWRAAEHLERLREMLAEAKVANDLDMWRRVRAVTDYIGGKRVVETAAELGVNRSAINRWLIWYNAEGPDALRTRVPPGRERALTPTQEAELATLIEGGPLDAGFQTAIWTCPLLAELIKQRFGVSYHPDHVSKLMARLGFSVQRPRKRLSRADAELQRDWVENRLPAIKKERPRAADS